MLQHLSTRLRSSTDSKFQMAPPLTPQAKRIIYPFNSHTNNLPPTDFRYRDRLPVPSSVVNDDPLTLSGPDDPRSEIVNKLNDARVSWVAMECSWRQLTENSSDPHDTLIVITVSKLPLVTRQIQCMLHEIYDLSGGSYPVHKIYNNMYRLNNGSELT